MKVGILTLHDLINPGSYLQAYCLQETVKELGVEVKIINYKPVFDCEIGNYLRKHHHAPP
jgi:hypothetical protein